jgi:hypothetical protein
MPPENPILAVPSLSIMKGISGGKHSRTPVSPDTSTAPVAVRVIFVYRYLPIDEKLSLPLRDLRACGKHMDIRDTLT